MPGFNKQGIKVLPTGKRMFDRGFRVKVLEAVDGGSELETVRAGFGLTNRELGRILAWRKRVSKVPEVVALAIKERGLRERLYEKAVRASEESLEPMEQVLEAPELQGKAGRKLLPLAVTHLRNRGQNAVKVLEGLGDFRRGGDDIPRELPRHPMFNLPPGSHVAVSVEISTGNEEPKDGMAGKRIIEHSDD